MRFSLLILLAYITEFAAAQPELFRGNLDPSIPSPLASLGYDLGDRFSDFHSIEKYIRAVASASDRVEAVRYGESYEHRPLYLLIISSPANLARLHEIRSQNLLLTDPRVTSSASASDAADTLPAIVWLSYGVHGNEASSPEAALALLYQLSAGRDSMTTRLLDSLVVLIDPVLNPDGRERYVRWYQSVAQQPPNPDISAFEHAEPWPGGRTNHYYFDLNRDWSWLTQRESLARIAMYRTWMPHTHVDFHEMGHDRTYFFFPATKPFHQLLPSSVLQWGDRYGRANAAALERIGSRYYVGEDFDMFYPGYGDSWPSFNGSIGMTYEQAGSGRAGLVIRRTDGGELRLRDRLRNHFTTGLATLETSVRYRSQRIRDFADFFRAALGPDKRKRSVVIPSTEDPTMRDRLSNTLIQQGIDVFSLTASARLPAQKFYHDERPTITFGEGSLLIPLNQPRGFLAAALLEPKTSLADTFFYDVSAWSLPVAFGVDAYEYDGDMPKQVRRVEGDERKAGVVEGPERPYAYILPTARREMFPLLASLLMDGVSAYCAHKSFELSGAYYPSGTVVVLPGAGTDSLHKTMQDLAATHGVDIAGVSSGWTDKGISLGSGNMQFLRMPRVAIATGEAVFSSDYGELWFLFEQELRMPFTAVDGSNIKDLDLQSFDVLIFPDGAQWRSILDSSLVSALSGWVSRGGTLIALEGAARSVGRLSGGIVAATLVTEEKKEEGEKKKSEEERKKRLAGMTQFEKEEYERRERIPGSIYRVLVDTTHPIGFGSAAALYALKGNAVPFSVSSEGHAVARFSADTVTTSGYASATRSREVAGSAYILAYRKGAGNVVLLGESATFRMFWRGPARLLMNAIFFLPRPERLVGDRFR